MMRLSSQFLSSSHLCIRKGGAIRFFSSFCIPFSSLSSSSYSSSVSASSSHHIHLHHPRLSSFLHSPVQFLSSSSFSSLSTHPSSSSSALPPPPPPLSTSIIGSGISSSPSSDSSTTITISSSSSLPLTFRHKDEMYCQLIQKSLEFYEKEKKIVDGEMQQVFSEYNVVLFLEGTPDAPKSMRSLNVMKMLTQIQPKVFVSIDVFEHPALLGFAITHSRKIDGPFLFKDGIFFGSNDQILKSFLSGQLQQIFGNDAATREKSKFFEGELPIALY